jgi:hypothetical protein
MFNDDDFDLSFDPSAHVPQSRSFDPLPAGTYRFAVTSIKPKMISENTTRQFTVELTVSDGEHKGRKVWGRHSERTTRTDEGMQKSVAIGQDRLSELMIASGAKGSNLAAVVGCEVEAKIKVRPASGNFDASNDVVAYVVPAAPAAKQAAPAPTSKPGFMARKG